MSRRFLKPLFSFWDPFFTEPIYIKRVLPVASKANRAPRYEERKEEDPQATFENFFKEHLQSTANLKAEERAFFEKHFPERVGKQFNPYETLGIDKNADVQKIKEAYRTNALKYHPKNDSTPEGQQKFKNISKAYNMLLQQKQANQNTEEAPNKSLFEDFHRQMENFNKTEAQEKPKQNQTNVKTEEKVANQANGSKVEQKSEKGKTVAKQQEKPLNSILKGAELYSESSYFELINGQRKLHVTKMYEKDGKTIKFDRVEQNREDGTVEVTQTFDDGKEVKNRKYVQGVKKHRYLH